MAGKNEDVIKSVISRCTVRSIRPTLLRWGRISTTELNDSVLKGTKRQITENVLQLVETAGLNKEIVGDLELAYIQLHSRSKLWKVYKLTGKDLELSMDPRALRSKLTHNLELRWRDGRVYGNMSLFTGAIWLRMHMSASGLRGKSKSKSYNHNSSVFLVAFPGSPYIIISRAGKRHTELVKEALISSMNGEILKDIQLSGRHVASLADIALKKDNEIVSRKYRDREEQENPLIEREERKRPAPEESFEETEEMVDANREEKRIRRDEMERKFGCGPQPVLQTLEYKFDLKFHGKTVKDLDCKSTVEIKGSSVLDGLCQMANSGLLKFPLPKHLTTVTSSARNSFTMESKKQ